MGRDSFLVLVCVFLIFLFITTGITVRRYKAMEVVMAKDWYSQGEAALGTGQAKPALDDFRNALAYSPGNSLYQLRLAQALAATGRVQEARTYLLSLRDREPGNGPVNLELARLAAHEQAIPEAIQYFHDAVYCEWPDPVNQRRAVRLELVKFLLDSDQKAAAVAELMSVAANLPPDASMHVEVGELLMSAGAYDDALRVFHQALDEDPHSAQALAGAGQCYFQTGQYAQAEHDLNEALHGDPKLAQIAALRDTARAVLDADPFMRWLGEQERARRAHADFDQSMKRLQACAGQRGIDLQAEGSDTLQTLYAQAMQKPVLSSDPEWVANTMDLVFAIEKATSQACGEPTGPDLALTLLAREPEGGRP
jgi:tetratricopeptide (TPR) repeat protein